MSKRNTSLSDGIVHSRYTFLCAVFLLICSLLAIRLIYVKLSDPDSRETQRSVDTVVKTGILPSMRGEIFDREGVPLVTNAPVISLTLNRTSLASGAANDTLYSLITMLEPFGIELPDHCPITRDAPYTLDTAMLEDEQTAKMLRRFAAYNECEVSSLSGTGLYELMLKKCDLDESLVSTPYGRKIIGIRYDMENADFSVSAPYTLLDALTEEQVELITPHLHSLHGVELTRGTKRYFEQGSSLCHVLGRIGPIYAEEAEEYIENKGYAYNAFIGKDGAERVFEDDLRGIDGEASYTFDGSNDVVDVEVTAEAKQGNHVLLSIDSGLQLAAEKALERETASARANAYRGGSYHFGEDCFGGAAVVVDVNTGEVLCSANVPSFDMNSFSEQFASLREDTHSPLLNRAMQGIYPPGSTFKILTAAAALDSGTISEGSYICDLGEYKKYAPTYTPRCWLFMQYGQTHGYVNVVDALKVSCNYFFYTVSDQMGAEKIASYAEQFGLGRPTGIELPESTGILASPAQREASGGLWNPGDTLQMGIGQSDHAFTPLQIASYMAAVVNGGHHYRSTILHEVVDPRTGEVIRKHEPEILNDISLSDDTVRLLKYAMHSVVDEANGTAQTVFKGKSYADDIGGKTGTAQMRGHSDTALFMGFAPYDDPKIAVAVVVEYGAESRHASAVAADIFDYYYSEMLPDEDVSDQNDGEIHG